jgi:2-phospho-L-lactate guanylyltransferase
MPTYAIIPVKPLRDSKRRLEHLLSADERADLIYRFLDNLLTVLNAAPGIDRVLVVTADPSVMGLAKACGAEVLVETEPAGLNAAVAQGVAHATEAGATAVLIMPADLPFARAEDVERMLRPLTADTEATPVARPLIALTGDEAEEGTNALLLAPPGDFTFHYGLGSFQAHLAEAVERPRSTYVVNAPGLRFDLDTESDWLVYNGYLVQVADE